ncbi:MAG: NAD(P)/FAD-dependent oxidoreductase [Anaerolineae bacterium]|nr:NAD(P)/FAD-dependent oxidoreductase [Anaerolineae bacterium]
MRRYVIVGNGVAGITAAQTIVRADPSAEVHIFGAEPYPSYRRPRLWEFIAGEVEQDALYFRPPEWYAERGIHLHLGVRATSLDPAAHRLTLEGHGRRSAPARSVEYDRLLLATGGRPFVPPFEGTDREGVFTLRTLDDALAMKTYARDVRSAAVIGGGLLGLETARALRTAGLETTVIEFAPYLLPRQLDAEGAQVLQALLEAQDLHILTDAATEAILGHERATGVRLKDGRVVDGELVLVSTGIRSRVELAREAGLEVNRGVVVDEQLRTSGADVYAAGDAAEFEGRVYGIIPAATEQAQVAAANMVAGGSATYSGTTPANTLKIVGIDLTCLGDATATGDEFVILRKVDAAAGVYRRLTLRDGKIVGAILLGDTQSVRPVKQLIATGRDVSAYGERLLDKSFDLRALAH